MCVCVCVCVCIICCVCFECLLEGVHFIIKFCLKQNALNIIVYSHIFVCILSRKDRSLLSLCVDMFHCYKEDNLLLQK